MNPQYAQQLLDKVRQDYNTVAADFSSARQAIWPEILPLFGYIKTGDRVLDWGCGNGRLVDAIKEKGGAYFGADISEKLVEIAKQRYPQENFQVTQPLRLPFTDAFFDIIYSVAVLHHIPSPDFRLEFLKEAGRVLKPDGFLILTVWQPKDKPGKGIGVKFWLRKILWLSRLDCGDVIEPWFGQNKGQRYLHCFSPKELLSLAQKAGFGVKESGLIKNDRGNRNNIYLVAKKFKH